MAETKLGWQSKLVLLVVLPFAAAGLVLQAHWWATQSLPVAIWSVGLSLLLGVVVLWLRAATPAGAATGAVITGSLMFSTATFPYEPWNTALPAVLTVSLLAWSATKLGRKRKELLGTAESRRGRSAAQVAANLGMAAVVCSEFVQGWLSDSHWFYRPAAAPEALFAVMLAALAEAAADTVSSEIGQVLGGQPRMITTLGVAEPGTDGAVSAAGTLAGLIAAGIVAGIGTWALRGDLSMFWISGGGAVFGFFFDSLLGATLERRGWLNNDGVNFLSTGSAAGFALGLMAVMAHVGVG